MEGTTQDMKSATEIMSAKVKTGVAQQLGQIFDNGPLGAIGQVVANTVGSDGIKAFNADKTLESFQKGSETKTNFSPVQGMY